MIIIQNCITLCNYFIHKIIGVVNGNKVELEYEYICFKNDYLDDDSDVDEPDCNCNLCYTFRNIIFFAMVKLNCKFKMV